MDQGRLATVFERLNQIRCTVLNAHRDLLLNHPCCRAVRELDESLRIIDTISIMIKQDFINQAVENNKTKV